MKVFHNISELRSFLDQNSGTRGFVPTMGALHEGHMSLIKRAKAENSICVCSIFVNPTQFDNAEDLKKYPRTLEADVELLKKNGCDVIFAPSADEMYPSLPKLSIDFGSIETVMEGEHRDGHFNGVGIVVSKLLHIVQATNAYFGLKDLQQVAIINQLVRDLSFQVNIVPCETVREPNGLARSSRNERLSKGGRAKAGIIQESLQVAKKHLLAGNSVSSMNAVIKAFYENYPDFRIEYFEVSDFTSLQAINAHSPEKKTAICTAVFFENVRLIDNVVF